MTDLQEVVAAPRVPEAPSAEVPPPAPAFRPVVVAVVAASAALALALRLLPAWGRAVERRAGQQLGIGAAPFTGSWSWAPAGTLVLPVLVAAFAVAAAPVVARRARWRLLLLVAVPAQAAWTLALAAPDGWSSLTANLSSRYDYLQGVGRVGSPGGFLAHFTERLSTYPTHLRGHPPGTVLLLWALDRIGLGGATVAVLLVLLCGGLTTVAVLVAARSLAGEAVARRVAPFLLLVPAAGVATNLDLLYAALGAWAVALFVLATSPDRPNGRALLAGSGTVFGAALLCSYGLALLVLPLAAVAVARRRLVALVGAGATTAFVVALPGAWGYWWPSGLHAVRHEYLKGLGGVRPGGPFAVFDVVALVAVLGPVAIVALARLRDRRLVPVVAGTGAAIVAALLSQMSKGEVERIWQPFVPWLVLACGALALQLDGPTRWRRTRVLLGVQAAAAVVLAAGLRSPW